MTKMDNTEEMKYAEMFSQWYSWGSPIGLGIFVLALTGSILMMLYAFKLFQS